MPDFIPTHTVTTNWTKFLIGTPVRRAPDQPPNVARRPGIAVWEDKTGKTGWVIDLELDPIEETPHA